VNDNRLAASTGPTAVARTHLSFCRNTHMTLSRAVLLLGTAMTVVPRAPASAQSAQPSASVPRLPTDRAIGSDSEPARPGDVIRVRIWREPDLSGDFPVDERGVTVLPRLGATDVTGRSADALRRDLVAAYLPMLSHSSVAVIVLRRVQVTGAVRNPGLYPLDPTVTIEEAIAVAGGVTADGRTDRVELVRGGRVLSVSLARDLSVADSPVRSGDQLRVPERSWLSRNAAFAASVTSVLGSLLMVRLR
jgi:protein involved in polysaccharide export with SLBB domain